MQAIEAEIILPKVRVEFEIRQSDFIVKAAKKNHLEASAVKIKFDRNSIVDLLMARDLTQDAMFHVQMVSEDKRSIRQKSKFRLADFDFDRTISLTLFQLMDVVQITIKD